MKTNSTSALTLAAWALLSGSLVAQADGKVQPAPSPATGDGAAAAPASRMQYELPESLPAPAASSRAPGTLARPAPADPATVARELGSTAAADEPSAAPAMAASPLQDNADAWLEFRRRYRVRGLLSVGVGTHGTYQAGIGLSTDLTPNTTASAGFAVGRWVDGWGWWNPDPFLDARGGPLLPP